MLKHRKLTCEETGKKKRDNRKQTNKKKLSAVRREKKLSKTPRNKRRLSTQTKEKIRQRRKKNG